MFVLGFYTIYFICSSCQKTVKIKTNGKKNNFREVILIPRWKKDNKTKRNTQLRK